MNMHPKAMAATPPHHQHHHGALHYAMARPPPGNATHSVLEILQQPPDTWYKDQFGRKATFDVAVKRLPRGCVGCADLRHLNVHLLYESGKPVENQNILRVASGLCLNRDDQSVLAIRIMEVSKNHQNQRFRVQISLPPCPLKPLASGVAGVISEPVLVLSKKNKRPVKSDTEEPQNKTVSKLKKSKCATSPSGSAHEGASPTTSAFNTPTHGPMRAPAPPEFDGLGDSMAEDDQWGAEVVRFRQPSQGLCLWANAAFNFMHRLQYQNRIDGASDESSRFQCPECRSTYGSRPVHRSDCDLALLLEQTGSIDEPHEGENTGKINNTLSPEKPRVANRDTSNSSATKPASRPSLPHTSSPHRGKRKAVEAAPAPTSFGATSMDLLAKNLNLGSWEGYSSLSKIMFSLEAGLKQPPPPDQAQQAPSKESKASDASMNSLNSLNSLNCLAGGSWSFGAPVQPSQLSLNLSSLISSVKGLSPDTAAFLQEQEAELTGDASLLRSLSKVSLSDFLPDGSSDRSEHGHHELIDVQRAVALNGTVVKDEATTHAAEDTVMAIACVDFRNCGLPAFDSSYTLVGSYFLSDRQGSPELRFLPNLYPLPPQMLQELENNVLAWRQAPNSLLLTRRDTNAESLVHLKSHVVRCLKGGIEGI